MEPKNSLSILSDPEGGRDFVMGKVTFYLLFFYLVVILIFSCALGYDLLSSLPNLLAQNPVTPIYILLLWYSVPYALIGSALCYVRKLYLFAFHAIGKLSPELIKQKNLNQETCLWMHHATIIYFVTRPILASLATYFVLLAFTYGVTSLFFFDVKITADGYIMIAAISFFTGFAGGKVLDGALSAGGRLVEEVLGSK